MGVLSEETKAIVWMFETTYNNYIAHNVTTPSNFRISPRILLEAIDRSLAHRDLIEDCHDGLNGSDHYKYAGYLAYWLSKLKPIAILEQNPNKQEILINEYVAINLAINYFYDQCNFQMLKRKVVEDLVYALRYRTMTARMLPSVFEVYRTGFLECGEHDHGF